LHCSHIPMAGVVFNHLTTLRTRLAWLVTTMIVVRWFIQAARAMGYLSGKVPKRLGPFSPRCAGLNLDC
jgi:hypothetical protein